MSGQKCENFPHNKNKLLRRSQRCWCCKVILFFFFNFHDRFSQFTDVSRLNESFEALTSQNLENLKDNSSSNENKEITINKNSISLESISTVKEKENLSEKIKILEEKTRFLQNENNELIKELNKKVWNILANRLIKYFIRKWKKRKKTIKWLN